MTAPLLFLLFIGTAWGPCAQAPPPAARSTAGPTDTLAADVGRSVIHWKGTKFRGLGRHEGTIRLACGAVYVRHGALVGGSFVVDMHTIVVTDIPAHEPVPRRRLRRYLMHEDFFAVATYPTARFVLTAVAPQQGRRHAVRGLLTLRGQTHPVTFDAEIRLGVYASLLATTAFSIDRQRWGVAYRGSRLTNDLVDDEIHLRLTIFAAQPPAEPPRSVPFSLAAFALRGEAIPITTFPP